MSKFIKLMQKMGYKDTDTKGVCFGLAHGLIQSKLIEEADWLEIHRIIASLKDDQMDLLVRLIDDKVVNEDLDHLDTAQSQKTELVGKHKDAKRLSMEEKGMPPELTTDKIEKIRAFVETVYMYHQGHKKEKEFTNSIKVKSHHQDDLYVDRLLEEEKDQTSKVFSQDQSEFEDLLGAMQVLAEGNQLVGFEIYLTGHSMGLVYIENGSWALIDHDRLVEGQIKEISDYLFSQCGKNYGFYEKMVGQEKKIALTYAWRVFSKDKHLVMEYEKKFREISKKETENIDEEMKETDMIIKAVHIGDFETIKMCRENQFNMDKKDHLSRTGLMYACKQGDEIIASFLIESGANVNEKDRFGVSPLMIACMSGDAKMVDLLIENGADINDMDKNGYTPLLIASWYGNEEVVKKLIDNRANIDEKLDSGETALMIASLKGHINIAKILLDNNADASNLENSGSRKMTLFLLEYGILVNIMNDDTDGDLTWVREGGSRTEKFESFKLHQDKIENLSKECGESDEDLKKDDKDKTRRSCREMIKGVIHFSEKGKGQGGIKSW